MKVKKLNKTVIRKFKLDKNMDTFLINTAKVYANGNISKWIRHLIMNYEPKYLGKNKKEDVFTRPPSRG